MGQYDSLRRRKDQRENRGYPLGEDGHGTISPIPRNPVMGAVSDAAGGVRSFLNKAQIPEPVPLVGGMGAGDLLVGEAPEEYDRWAYGFHPFKDKNVPGYAGVRGIPEIQEQRAGPLTDALFMGADATGVGMGVRGMARAGTRGVQRGFNKAISDTGQDVSRRQFVKNAGIIGAGTAAASAVPDLLKGLTRTVAKAAPSPVTAATRAASKFKVGSIAEMARTFRRINSERNLGRAGPHSKSTNTPEYKAELARLQKIEDDLSPDARRNYDEDFPQGGDDGWGPDMEDYLDEQYMEATGGEYKNPFMDRAESPRPSVIFKNKTEKQAWLDSKKKYEAELLEYRAANPEYSHLPTADEYNKSYNDITIPHEIGSGKGQIKGYRADRAKLEAAHEADFGMLSNERVGKLLDEGGTYTDPLTGNKAVKIRGFENQRGQFQWESPSGQRAAHQHWLPDYVPDNEINIYTPDGRRMPEKFMGDPELRRKFLESPEPELPF